MSRGFAHSNEHLLHLLWFNVTGTHLGASSTAAAPSARSFYSPWAQAQRLREARGLQQLQGISAWAVGWLPDPTAAGSPRPCLSLSHQYFAISPPLCPLLSSVCCLPTLPLLCPKPSTTNKDISRHTPAEWGRWGRSLASLSSSSCRGSRSEALRGWLVLTKEEQNKVD